MRHCDTYQIPAYAVPYIANDDPTGLSDLEIELIDGFMAATSLVDAASIGTPASNRTSRFRQSSASRARSLMQ